MCLNVSSNNSNQHVAFICKYVLKTEHALKNPQIQYTLSGAYEH